MNHTRAGWRRGQGRREAGYTVLMVIFFVATLALVATVATPNLLNQGRREREEEMVWRGKQYVRAIRLYYQSNGRFPPSLEELTEPNAAGVHFLRKVYADPMNPSDGSWREIYVAPSGELTGSVRYKSLQEIAVSNALNGAAPVAPSGAPGNAPAQQQPGEQPDPASPVSTAEPVSAGSFQPDGGTVFGASLIGLGSKTKRPSLRIYEGGETYYEWEFIWNPLAHGITTLPGGTPPAQPAGAADEPAGQADGQPDGQPDQQGPETGAPGQVGEQAGEQPAGQPNTP